MAFRRRFQTGTLGRSIRRFGRFPRTGFKRKQFATYYGTALQTIAVTADPEVAALSMVSASELAPAASVATGANVDVRNVSVDWLIHLNLIQDIASTGGNPYGTPYIHWMVFVQDVDEDITTFQSLAATNVAIRWGAWAINPWMTSSGAAAAGNNPTMNQKERLRFRMSTLRHDQELVFAAARSETEDMSAEVNNINISHIARVRYEIP